MANGLTFFVFLALKHFFLWTKSIMYICRLLQFVLLSQTKNRRELNSLFCRKTHSQVHMILLKFACMLPCMHGCGFYKAWKFLFFSLSFFPVLDSLCFTHERRNSLKLWGKHMDIYEEVKRVEKEKDVNRAISLCEDFLWTLVFSTGHFRYFPNYFAAEVYINVWTCMCVHIVIRHLVLFQQRAI